MGLAMAVLNRYARAMEDAENPDEDDDFSVGVEATLLEVNHERIHAMVALCCLACGLRTNPMMCLIGWYGGQLIRKFVPDGGVGRGKDHNIIDFKATKALLIRETMDLSLPQFPLDELIDELGGPQEVSTFLSGGMVIYITGLSLGIDMCRWLRSLAARTAWNHRRTVATRSFPDAWRLRLLRRRSIWKRSRSSRMGGN